VIGVRHGVDTITDFGADDMLLLGRGLGFHSADDVAGNVVDFGGDAFLDLGDGDGLLFLGLGADELTGLLDSNLGFV
jgi:hypothetical protein